MGLIWMRTTDQIKSYIDYTGWEKLDINLKSMLKNLIIQDMDALKVMLPTMHSEFKPDAEKKLREVQEFFETLIQRGLV